MNSPIIIGYWGQRQANQLRQHYWAIKNLLSQISIILLYFWAKRLHRDCYAGKSGHGRCRLQWADTYSRIIDHHALSKRGGNPGHREHLTYAMSINAYSRQKLENLQLDHKEKWDYNSYNLQFRIALDGRNNSMLSENEKRIKELCQELGQCL